MRELPSSVFLGSSEGRNKARILKDSNWGQSHQVILVPKGLGVLSTISPIHPSLCRPALQQI